MNAIWLRFTMKSDAAFGSGSGTPGLIDQEILVDESGLPYLHGRTLKGLLNEVCADILYASGAAQSPWKDVADSLFGKPGSDESARGVLMVGHAQLPESLRVLLQREVQQGNWDREVVFDSLTTVREQTAMNPDGSPEEKSLRTTRLILREGKRLVGCLCKGLSPRRHGPESRKRTIASRSGDRRRNASDR